MDLDDYRQAVRNRMGNPSGDALFTDNVVRDLVNDALAALAAEHDWAWLEASVAVATAAADGSYTLPGDYGRTVSVTHPDGYALKRANVQDLDLLGDAAGPPKVFAVFGSELLLAPVPTGVIALKHRYVATEEKLVDPTDEPKVPDRWANAVVEYAAYLGYRREGNLQDSGGARAAFDALVQAMRLEAGRYSESTGGGEPVPMPASGGERKA